MIEEEEDSSNYHVDYDYSSSFFPPAGDHCDRLQCLLLLFLRCCEWRTIQHQYRKADSPYSPQPIGTDNDICGTKEKRREENPLPIDYICFSCLFCRYSGSNISHAITIISDHLKES
jgi:hypothetical protein